MTTITPQSSSYHASSIAKLREDIDAELAILQARIRTLHSKRNTLASVYQLPPEILVRIFSSFQRGVVSTPYMKEQQKYTEWARILQVSQYWRELVLGSKALWSNIAVTDRHWVEKFYERSGTNDLSIDFKFYGFASLLKSVVGDPQRISSLKISIMPSYWEDTLPLLKFPAPKLKVLKLEPRLNDFGETNCVLPADIFCGECPELRDLYVDSCDIDLRTPLFNGTNLTSLCIRSPANAIGGIDMVHFLQRLPQLRLLSLSEALTINTVPHAFIPIHIPNLTWLELDHIGLEINAQFLRLITIPETTDLRLECFALHLEPMPVFEEMMDSVIKRAYGNTSLVFRDIDISWSTHKISVVCMRNPRPRSGILASPSVQLDFGFRESFPNDYIGQWFHQLPRSFLAPVEALSLEGTELSVDNWNSLSHSMPNLQRLILADATLFVEYLDTKFPDVISESHLARLSGQPVTHDIVYPALRSLTLPLQTIEHAERLCRPLAIRRRNGLALEELTITQMADDPALRNQLHNVLIDTISEIRWMP
ncbi:hypothetical protein BDN72DRAFT_114262 [Pluteus cervinus]|uniref:Uncharacterized protein n=1 Tax=Pluteus cervinus TaxID=181527 RepID=A0ACD3ANT1_9AGAR|nr:hypothetical protein BDN72DRAFT_114262 [Pluteus cervinus]